jgi:hypothetical protein
MGQQLRIPSPFELAEVVDDVLTEWAFLSARPAGKPAEGPVPFVHEFSLRHGAAPGVVAVLRFNQSFASELLRSTGDGLHYGPGRDSAYLGLCERVGAALAKKMGAENWVSGKVEVEPSRPESWPRRAPDSQCVIIADRFPIEFRLWAGSPAKALEQSKR